MIIKLSEAGIKEAVYKIRFLKDSVDVGSQRVVEELVARGVEIASVYNASAPQSGLEKSNVVGKTTESGNKGYIALIGESAVYDEFGTGEQGASDPHPMKGNFGLNPYNSGPHIFYNEFAGKYQWRYRPMAGKPYFTKTGLTEGIPSGKQMYNTAKDIRAIKNNTIAKELNSALRRFR